MVEPYHPPTTPSSIQHVALSSKSFRVFGLDDIAWRNARRDWRRYKSKSSAATGGVGVTTTTNNNNGNGGGGNKSKRSNIPAAWATNDNDSDSDYTSSESEEEEDDVVGVASREEEEAEEMAMICNAVTTALEEDAGGFGTAGLHVSKVDSVKLLSNLSGNNNSAVYSANLIPCDAETKQPVDPSSLFSVDEETGEIRGAIGNDLFYITGDDGLQIDNAEGRSTHNNIQIRITVSRAEEGLAAKTYYEALFAKRKGLLENLDEDLDVADFDVDLWVEEDEDLRGLRQSVIDAREGHRGDEKGDVGPSALGYYVELMLVEPHVRPNEHVVAPPTEVDKSSMMARSSKANDRFSSRAEEVRTTEVRSVFQGDIYATRQFMPAGPWERANVKAFGDVGLDLRKALVRVEFPVFPEGCKEKTFRETYQLNARLKSGSFATVCRGTHRATGKKIAVKCVLRKDLPPSDDAAIYDEVLILSTLRHTYICPLIDFFEEKDCYFLVMELMSGGDLFDRIGKRKNYTEDDARGLCRKMLESVRYCHENSVAHCDMKPKNLLLVSDDDDVQMKLADFGFATRVYEPQSLTKQCGTPFFVAPEVLMRSPYDQQSDMWSCGVIMFLLLGGDLPFVGRNQKELFRNIVMGKYEFQEDSWAHVSEQAKDLVKQLLVTDPSRRLSSREAMASPWMRQRGNLLAKNNLQYTSKRLKGFNARMKLRASMICVSSVVSLRMSMRSLGSLKSDKSVVSSASKSESPSFLASLPDEEGSEDEDEE